MKKVVYFIKTGPYLSVKDPAERFDSYLLTTTGRYSPKVVPGETKRELAMRLDKKFVRGAGRIFCSRETRAFETATMIGNLYTGKDLVIESSCLFNEVSFDIKSLVTKGEYIDSGSALVRKRFVEAFVNDSLQETRSNLRKRMNDALDFLRVQKGEKLLVVSHSFFMKILQSYLTDRGLFENPVGLNGLIKPEEKTFECCDGFKFKL